MASLRDWIQSLDLISEFVAKLAAAGLTDEVVKRVIADETGELAKAMVKAESRTVLSSAPLYSDFAISQIVEVIDSGLPAMYDFDPRRACAQFVRAVRGKDKKLYDWVSAASIFFLQPVCGLLLKDYESRGTVEVTRPPPDRRGYERLYEALREGLRGVARSRGEPEPNFPPLDVPCGSAHVDIAFGGRGRVDVNRQFDPGRDYIFWVRTPGLNPNDRAEVIVY